MFENKKVLVTGGSGMVGRALVSKLLALDAKVTIVDLHHPSDLEPEVNFVSKDLRYLHNCEEICNGQDYIFNIIGVKGSPKACAEQPADFMVPMLQFNTNMMEAARRANVKWYLYTSSVGVYSPADVFYEDDVWKTFPSPNDKFAGWAKRMGELQAEAYSIQYGYNNISIVRPANIFGKYDNFNPVNSMVIPSLIRKAQENDVLEVWGNGSSVRDFIFADDVANSMIQAVEKQVTEPINLGSGKGFTIKELVEIVVRQSGKNLEIKWLTDKPNGDAIRIMSTERAEKYGIVPTISLEEGVGIVTEWFKQNKNTLDQRYNVFVNH
jgi:GDP-L-fucose synthase